MKFNNRLENSLFKNCNLNSLEKILDPNKIILKPFEKNSIMFYEYQKCKSMNFIIKSSLYIN